MPGSATAVPLVQDREEGNGGGGDGWSLPMLTYRQLLYVHHARYYA